MPRNFRLQICQAFVCLSNSTILGLAVSRVSSYFCQRERERGRRTWYTYLDMYKYMFYRREPFAFACYLFRLFTLEIPHTIILSITVCSSSDRESREWGIGNWEKVNINRGDITIHLQCGHNTYISIPIRIANGKRIQYIVDIHI